MNIKFAPVRWTLIKVGDFYKSKNTLLNSFNYINSPSAQSVYFKANTIFEALAIKNALIEQRPFPNKSQARQAFDLLKENLECYEWSENDDIWYIKNNSEYDPEQIFEKNDWKIVFFGVGENVSFDLPKESFQDFVFLMEMLNGEYSLNQISSMVRERIYCQELLVFLAKYSLIIESPKINFKIDELPEISFLGHSSVLLNDGEDLFVIDPLYSPLLENEKYYNSYFSILNRCSLILISHFHWDHLHFQTLVRIQKNKLIAVPKVDARSLANPSLKIYLESMGFTNVIEVAPLDVYFMKRIKLKLFPFYGESFGLNSRFDGLTYLIEIKGKKLLGTVDACHNEAGKMKNVISDYLSDESIDFMFFGVSGQRHALPFMAAGFRHFSNELIDRLDLIRYHPNIDDITEWLDIVKVKYAIPYAEFILDTVTTPNAKLSCLDQHQNLFKKIMESRISSTAHMHWFESLNAIDEGHKSCLIFLQPVQGIEFH